MILSPNHFVCFVPSLTLDVKPAEGLSSQIVKAAKLLALSTHQGSSSIDKAPAKKLRQALTSSLSHYHPAIVNVKIGVHWCEFVVKKLSR